MNAVIAFLRNLEGPPAARRRPARRPDWCGTCEETTRLLTEPESGVTRRCPTCHPKSRHLEEA